MTDKKLHLLKILHVNYPLLTKLVTAASTNNRVKHMDPESLDWQIIQRKANKKLVR
jgi:hypothetical protein